MLHAPNQVELWGKELAARFDTNRIAMGGHSFGGASVICAAAADPRVITMIPFSLPHPSSARPVAFFIN
jgi:predicted dienelactone hydrolase